MKRGPSLEHVTANTGHVRTSPRSEVADEVLSALRPLLAMSAVTGARFGVRHPRDPWTWTATERPGALSAEVLAPDGRPVARFAAGADGADHARAAWDDVAADGAKHPAGLARPPAPWLIVALLPALADWSGRADSPLEWLSDFPRCAAWAWLDLVEGATGREAAKRAARFHALRDLGGMANA